MAKTHEHKRLGKGKPTLNTAIESRLSVPSRLRDLLIAAEETIPGEARRKGSGVDINYGYGDTQFRLGLIA